MTAADRPSVPRVGDTITNPDQLDALPVGVVMRARNDLLTETGRLGADGMRVVWGEGWSDHAAAIEHLAPLTVLYVPGEPSRPSVTDNARAEGGRVGQIDCLDCGAMAVTVHHFDQCPAVWGAAGRAETTTDEWPRCKASRDGGCDRCHDEHGRHIHCRAETTTATTADTTEALYEATQDPNDIEVPAVARPLHGLLASRDLLATARTRPTRQQIIDALVMSPLSDTAGTDLRPFEQTADAVLALLRGGDRDE